VLHSCHESLPVYLRHLLSFGVVAILVIVLGPNPSKSGALLAFVVLTALFTLYRTFTHVLGQDYEHIDERERLGTAHVVRAIAYRAVGLLAAAAVIVILTLPGRSPFVVKAFLAGSIKAAHWIAVFWLVR
jgi:hypothetical protein